ncbi:MAG: hypothetical protein R2911_07155 [Caldilineaceae bacterium]
MPIPKKRICITILLLSVLTACNPSLRMPTGIQSAPHLGVTSRVRLADDGYDLVDLRVDESRIYVTDSADQLHVLDRKSLAVMRTVAVNGGQLTLDRAHHRLFVAPGTRYISNDAAPRIAVIDTQTLDTVRTLPGRYVSVDAAHNRVYTGVPLTLEIEQAMAAQTAPDGVRLFDGDTLAEVAVGAQPGIPVYNPARNELLIVAYTVYSADAQTLATQRDLLPALADQELRWCTGCKQAVAAALFPNKDGAADLLLLELGTAGGGKGAGIESTQRWLNARTLAPADYAPAVQQMCGSQRWLRPPVNGRVFRSIGYSRYLEIYNVRVEDLMGAELRQIDGLQLLYVDEQTSEGLAALSGIQNLRLDLVAGTPLGLLPAFCLLGVSEDKRILYGAAGGDLLQVEPTGITAAVAVAPLENASANISTTISPDPATPQELLGLDPAGVLYRSADGGQAWRRLEGGLPQWASADVARVTLEPSPDFAEDRPLFWAAVLNGGAGLGVWRSVDGGASWQPVWQGLDHLRVTQLEISPNFATDQTLWATADFARIADASAVQENGAASPDAAPPSAIETGRSLWRSTNRGESWSLVAVAADDAGLPDRK